MVSIPLYRYHLEPHRTALPGRKSVKTTCLKAAPLSGGPADSRSIAPRHGSNTDD